jgi:hypothetical protein
MEAAFASKLLKPHNTTFVHILREKNDVFSSLLLA